MPPGKARRARCSGDFSCLVLSRASPSLPDSQRGIGTETSLARPTLPARCCPSPSQSLNSLLVPLEPPLLRPTAEEMGAWVGKEAAVGASAAKTQLDVGKIVPRLTVFHGSSKQCLPYFRIILSRGAS